MASATSAGRGRHHIPVIDRMMEVLAAIEEEPRGATITDLAVAVAVPRTTVYRILKTLESHRVVRRSDLGAYTLGPRLRSLSARIPAQDGGYDLAAVALPHLRRLSGEIGESSKVSIMESGATVVLVGVQGKREYALAIAEGQRLPIHAGAGSKVLLAHAGKAERETALRQPLEAFTERTYTRRAPLIRELAKVKRQGWSQDKGEFSPSVHAFGAPVIDSSGRFIGAVSVPFLAGADARRMEVIRRSVIAAATAIGASVPTGPRPDRDGG
jgi:IclR family pca regulon transcriptional regulator/IclR family acetate operon transcriptional repressor